YTDIMNSPDLAEFVFKHEPPGKERARLTHLTGVGPNQLRVGHGDSIRDGIDLVLRIAEINLEILMGQSLGECDLGTSAGADALLKGKLMRSGAVPELVEQFQSLLELENIPDVRSVVSAGEVSIAEIWKLRQTKEGSRFREWLRDASTSDSRD